MQCRDQGVQVETSLRQRKPVFRDQRCFGDHMTTMVNSASLKNLSKITTSQVLPSTASSCYEFPYRLQQDQLHHKRHRYPQRYAQFQELDPQPFKYSYQCSNANNNNNENKAIPSELHEMKYDVQRILNDDCEQNIEVHHCIEDGCMQRGVCTIADGTIDGPKTMAQPTRLHTKRSQKPCNNGGDSKTTVLPRIECRNEPPMGQQERQQHVTQIVQSPQFGLPTVEEVEFKAIKGRKILIFGGIDPYCQHCQQDKVMALQQQEQRKRTQTLVGSDADILDPLHYHNGIGGCSACGGLNPQINQMDNFGDRVLYYDAGALQWKHLCYLPFGSRHHHAAVVCNGLIYIIGGTKTALGCTKKSIFEKSVWSFDPLTLKWTFESNLPELRRDFAAIVSDEYCGGEVACEHCKGIKEQHRQRNIKAVNGFFVIGGEGVNGTALRTVWYYNVVRKTWKKKAPLHVGRYGLMAAMVNNEIWIAGGIIETKTRASDNYDGFVATSMPTVDGNNQGGRGAAIDGADGGGARDNNGSGDSFAVEATKSAVVDVITDTMEYYSLKCAYSDEYVSDVPMAKVNDVNSDAAVVAGAGDGTQPTIGRMGRSFESGRWIKAKQRLRIPRLFGKFCRPSDNELYLVGGIGFDSNNILTSLSSVDHYDFSEGHWHHYGDIKWARHGHDIATLNDRIVIVGGVSTIKKRTLTKVETFCMETRRNFKDMPELPWPLSGCAVLALD
nr:uncharacterized protein LOC106620395 [Bactrocera oleae]